MDGSLDHSGYEGDSRYLCPHLLNRTDCLQEADIFSLGASIYELVCMHALRVGVGVWISTGSLSSSHATEGG